MRVSASSFGSIRSVCSMPASSAARSISGRPKVSDAKRASVTARSCPLETSSSMNLPCAPWTFFWMAVACSGLISWCWTSARARPGNARSSSVSSGSKLLGSSSPTAFIWSVNDLDSCSTNFCSLSCSTTIGSTVACARNLTRSIACRSVGSDSSTVSRLPRLAIGTMRVSASSFGSIRSVSSMPAVSAATSISGRPKVSDAKRASVTARSCPLETSSSMNLPCAASAFCWMAVACSELIRWFWTRARARPHSTVSFAAVSAAPVIPAASEFGAPRRAVAASMASGSARPSSASSGGSLLGSSSATGFNWPVDDWDSCSTNFCSLSCSTTIGSTAACARNLTRSIACRSVGSDSSTVSRLPRLAIGTMRVSASSFASIRSVCSMSASSAATSISGRPKVSDAKRASVTARNCPLETSSSMNLPCAMSTFFWIAVACSELISWFWTSARARPHSTVSFAAVAAAAVVPARSEFGVPRRAVDGRTAPGSARPSSAASGWKLLGSSSTAAFFWLLNDWDSCSTNFCSLSCSTTIGSTVACALNLTRSIACRSVGSDSSTVSRLPRLAIGTMRVSASSFGSIRSVSSMPASSAARSISGRPKVAAVKRARLSADRPSLLTSTSMNFPLAGSVFF